MPRTDRLAGSGLDAPLPPARLKEIAAARQRERFGRVIDPALERVDDVSGSGRALVQASADHRPTLVEQPIAAGPGITATATLGPAEWPIRAARWLNGFRCTVRTAPRTKKNSTTLGIRQSPAYRAYRDTIVNGFAPLLAQLELPLPDRPYTLAAMFYVDRWGERADLVGLLQGLADALENAGVVRDDKWFRAFDGSRVVTGDPAPRVELMITDLD